MEVPSMVCSQGGALIVRSLVSGDQLILHPPRGGAPDESSNIVNNSKDVQEPVAIITNNNNVNQDENEDQSSSVSSNLKIPSNNSSLNNNNDNTYEDNNGAVTTNNSSAMTNNKKDEKLPQCKIKRNYSCNNCSYFTQNPRRFLMHLRDTHGERITINECKLCLYASRHYQKLVRHMRMVHGSTEGINEPSQSRRGQSRGWKLGRKRSLDEDEELINEPNFIPNGLSNDSDEYKSKLEKCTLCSFTSLSRDSLIAHEREDHAKTKFFRCHKCSYVTHIKARFSKHVKYHSMPMIKCMMCDFRTPYKWNLDRHMKNHGGAGPFKCSACSFSADIKQSLTVHETNHHIPPIEHNGSSGESSLSQFLQKNTSSRAAADWPEDLSMSSSQHSQDEDLPLDFTLNKTSDSEQQGDNDSIYRIKKRPIPNLIPINDSYNVVMKDTPKQNESSAYAAVGLLNEIYLKTLKNISMMFANNNQSGSNQTDENTIQIEELDDVDTPSQVQSSPVKKSMSIFEKLKEKMANVDEECPCGFKPKTLTSMLLHQNQCQLARDESAATESIRNMSPAMFSSTRCQFCRHRCKTTDDLLLHLRVCDAKDEQYTKREESSDEAPIDNPDASDWADEKPAMNFLDQILFHNIEEVNEENGGDLMKKSPFVSMKKVFKCPHCSFWASTASRFHVHIVGHLNKKPFECSLCAYRSNWRWDITKHIRLKTVRDINHKNARVLMNDETGRRNYTKYNKYVTLMGVNETEFHSKQSKSEDSALSPTEIVPPSNSSDTSGSSRDNNLDTLSFSAMSNREQRFLAQLHQQHQPQSTPMAAIVDESHSDVDSNNKKIHFKCKKCNFKSYDRDEVLGHVKQHYIDAGLFVSPVAPSSSTPPLINIPMPPQLQKVPDLVMEPRMVTNLLDIMPNITIKPPSLSVVPNGENTTGAGNYNNNSNNNSSNILIHNNNPVNSNATTSSSPSASSLNVTSTTTNAMPTSTFMLNSLPSALNTSSSSSIHPASNPSTLFSVVIPPTGHTGSGGTTITTLSSSSLANTTNTTNSTTTTTGGGTSTTTGWRGPAPYRCGHCHQVSNWKHVIQRHCRLKHNGNISIEHLGKTSSGNTDNRRRQRFQQQQQQSQVLQQTPLPPAVTQQVQASSIPTLISTPEVTAAAAITTDAKRYKCQFCPYESNSKSQLQYHSSFHTQKSNNTSDEVYSCTFCTYSVTRRHLLLQHLKMHSAESVVVETVDLGGDDGCDVAMASTNIIPTSVASIKKQIFYCPHCPARYMSKMEIDTHVSMHNGGMAFKCKLCTYSAATDSNMQAHVTVHSTYYQEKTKEFQRKYQGNIDYPPPKIAVADVSAVPSTSSNNNTSGNDSASEQFWVCEPRPFLKIHEHHLLSLLTQCKFCPFTAAAPEELKTHVVHHRMFGGCTFEHKCDHCDYSSATKEDLICHKRLHFTFIDKNVDDHDEPQENTTSTTTSITKNLAFYTHYDKLQLKCMDLSRKQSASDSDEDEGGGSMMKSIYNDTDAVLREKLARLSAIKDDEKMIVEMK